MFIFDGPTKRIFIDPTATSGSVIKFTPQQLWTEWVIWVSISDNSKYLPAFESVMIPLDETSDLGQYLFMRNDLGWRGVPPIADHVSIIVNGSLYAKDSTIPMMENIPNQETDFVINRSTLTNTVFVNSSGGSAVDLTEVLNKLNAIQIAQAKQMTVGDFLSLS